MAKHFLLEHMEIVEEWNQLFSSIMETLSDGEERKITAPLFTMVQVSPHVYKKSQIVSIKMANGYFTGKHLVLGIENEDGKSYVNVYPQFELKTEGKIKDIVLLLLFIKSNMSKNKTIEAEETIV